MSFAPASHRYDGMVYRRRGRSLEFTPDELEAIGRVLASPRLTKCDRPRPEDSPYPVRNWRSPASPSPGQI